MNDTYSLIMNRKSMRVYDDRDIDSSIKNQILAAAMRAPTAGNLMLYSIIEVNDQSKKDILAKSCDNQPFIARAPWILLFLADYQRWSDYFAVCSLPGFCRDNSLEIREPQEGDLFLACCDALVAAQTSVIAAESFGIGSCYIGDIMENYELHRGLFSLPRFVFPICLLCFGYPTASQLNRLQTTRFDRKFIVFSNQYRHFGEAEQKEMFQQLHRDTFGENDEVDGARNVGQLIYKRKFGAQFAYEMNRSVRAILKAWKTG